MGAFFVAVCVLLSSIWIRATSQRSDVATDAQSCLAATGMRREAASVTRVIDGETLRLIDGRTVHLIGIDAPDVGVAGELPQPYAEAARRRLAELLSATPRLTLEFGIPVMDTSQRLQAHVYQADGTTVQERLLRDGLAAARPVPPNISKAACYAATEQVAQAKSAGIWSLRRYQVRDAAALSAISGYQLVRGAVTGIEETAEAIGLSIDGGALTLEIAHEDIKYFESYALDSLADRRIIARGTVSESAGRKRMQIRHPSALVRVD